MKLTAVILTNNEEKNVQDCLESLKFCDEVIVVDDESTDKTVKKCQISDVKCQIYRRKLNGDFASQRNFGLEKAKGDWILFVDADERVSWQLANEIIQIINNPTLHYDGLFLKRHDYIWGKRQTHGEVGSVKLLRLAKKGTGQWSRKVHEVWQVKGEKYDLKNSLWHYPHQTLREFLTDINLMSNLDIIAKIEEKKNSSLVKIFFWPVGKFIYNYFFRLGFLDGIPGLMVGILMSFHSFLSWSKLWIFQRKN